MDKPRVQIKDFLSDRNWDYADRRKGLRYPCQLEGSIKFAEGAVPCEIMSLSSGGLSARCLMPLGKGDLVQIAVGDHRPILCRVEWASRARTDMMTRFSVQEPAERLPESWLAAQLEALALAKGERQRRGGVRVNCEIPATLSWDGQERAAVLRDLGTTGARVECEGDLLPSDLPIILRFDPETRSSGDVAVTIRVSAIHDPESKQYGVTFGTFESGGPEDLMSYMNQLFTARRAAS